MNVFVYIIGFCIDLGFDVTIRLFPRSINPNDAGCTALIQLSAPRYASVPQKAAEGVFKGIAAALDDLAYGGFSDKAHCGEPRLTIFITRDLAMDIACELANTNRNCFDVKWVNHPADWAEHRERFNWIFAEPLFYEKIGKCTEVASA